MFLNERPVEQKQSRFQQNWFVLKLQSAKRNANAMTKNKLYMSQRNKKVQPPFMMLQTRKQLHKMLKKTQLNGQISTIKYGKIYTCMYKNKS